MSNRKKQPTKKKKANKPKSRSKKNAIGGAPVNGGYAMAPKTPKNGPVVQYGVRKVTNNNHVRATCSILDPFCPAARGARLPDGLGNKTMGQQLRGKFSFVGGLATATSNGAVVIMAGAPYGYAVASAVTGGNYNFGSAWTIYNGGATIGSYVRNYRIVSFGVLVRCTSSVPNTSGSVCFNSLPPDWCVIAGNNIPPGSTYFEEQQVYPLSTGAQYCWISKPQGSASKEFVSFTGPASDFSLATTDYPSMTNLMIEITGSSSTTTLEVEYFLNIEGQVNPTTLITGFIPPETAPNPLALNAKNKVVRSASAAQPGGVESFEKWAVGKAGQALAGYAGGPLAAAFAAMTVD